MVEIIKEGIEDTITAFGVLEIAHDFQAPPDLPETSFDNICGADSFTDYLREVKDRDQLMEVFFEAGDGFGDELLPCHLPVPEAPGGHSRRFGIHDLSRLSGALGLISFRAEFGHIAKLMNPAELMCHRRINLLNG